MKKINERWTATQKISESTSEDQEFIKIDDNHAYGDHDGLVYQILPYSEVFDSEGNFKGNFKPIEIYVSEDGICFNYAEDGELEGYLKNKGLTLITQEDEDGYHWFNEGSVSKEIDFETVEELEYYLKDNKIEFIINGLTIMLC